MPDLQEWRIRKIVNDGKPRESLKSHFGTILFGIVVTVFVIDLVLPVPLAAIVRTDRDSALGRPGFLGPVLIVADSETRRLVVQAAIGTVIATGMTCFLGTLLGLAASGSGGRLFRTFRWLMLLPGCMPAWVFPACFVAIAAVDGLNFPADWGLFAWIGWAGWWGATRQAAAFAAVMKKVPREEWDASRILGRSTFSTMRTILAPRLASTWRNDAKRVALTTLFDPAPVLFLGVRRWPVAEVLGLLRQFEVRTAVEAASWMLWLLAIAAANAFLLRLALGSRTGIETDGESAANSRSFEKSYGTSPVRWLALPAVWPVVALAGLLAKTVVDGRIRPESLAMGSDFFRVDPLVASSILNGLIFAASIATFLWLVSRLGGTRRFVRIAGEIVSWWSFEMAACAIAIGGICMTGLGFWVVPGSPASGATPLWPIALSVYVLANRKIRHDHGFASGGRGGESPSNEPAAAFDSAMTMGFGRSRAESLARWAGVDRAARIPWFSTLPDSWWLWISPAWAFVPLWSVSAVPTVGQLLVERLLANPAGSRFAEALILFLACAAVFAMVARAAAGRRIGGLLSRR